MANHPSAVKRNRQSEKKQHQNRWWRSRVRAASKAVTEAVGKKNKKDAQKSLQAAMTEIGKAKGKGVLHAKTASRKVARLSKLVASL